jgi:dihydrofolate synthase / folylpolyglutamate synthase
MEYSKERYNALIASLFERHPSVQKVGFAAGAYKPGLEGMLRFDSALGEPWKKFSTIHIAGTNGKGSVSSMLAAALAATGLRVGLYTSPHLVDFRERMKVISGGSWTMVSEEYVWDFLNSAPLDDLSFFEITTGMAFSWFASQKVDVAVIETGLGGRLDSTNIITPELSIITSIGLDHCAMLGNTRALIASEKAGIFKSGVPALVANCDDETAPVFERKAAEVHCPLFFADDFAEPDFRLDLEGPYQRANLHTVLAALELLGIEPDTEALKHSGRITGFRGRWEKLCDKPETICDIGHNPDALRINFARLAESGRPLFIVYGIMADKDLDTIRPLMPADARYYLVAPAISRSLPVDELYARTEGLVRERYDSVAEGVKAAMQDAAQVPGSLVYIGGSNFVVSECISYLEKDF